MQDRGRVYSRQAAVLGRCPIVYKLSNGSHGNPRSAFPHMCASAIPLTQELGHGTDHGPRTHSRSRVLALAR